MNRIKLAAAALCLFFSFSLQAQNIMTGELNNLSKIRTDVKTKRVSSYDRSGANRDRFDDVKPGESRVLFDVEGAGIINHIWITLAPMDFNRDNVVLKMYWDGNDQPSVLAPLGSFFGQGWGERYTYNTLPLVSGPAAGAGLVCYFTMPFAKGAKIVIENQDEKPIRHFYYYVDYMAMKKLPSDLGRFHAWYNRQLEIPEEGETAAVDPKGERVNTDGKHNYLFVDVKGKGHFIGINYFIDCPTPQWYGEGDDMWYIDGEEMPSMIGTGTEDFFNTSWCPREVFLHPYYGCPRINEGIGFMGRTHVYRYFIADPILFDKSVKGTIEHGHANNLTLDLSSVAYWYQSEATVVPDIPSVEGRKPMAKLGGGDIEEWRREWLKSKGEERPWGR